MRTYVYVDGFNLYYGAVRRTPYKWLNIRELCERLFPKNEIACIRYFTALVNGTLDDPSKPQRQQTFIRALETLDGFSVHYGSFLSNKVWMPRAKRRRRESRNVEVVKTEEKGSDVNLASLLLADGFRGKYKVAVVLSNDSDLTLPVEIVTRELGLPVGLLNPHERFSVELSRVATFKKKIREGVLRDCQFPDIVIDDEGKEIHKPADW
jgi:NYN domain-containing protein